MDKQARESLITVVGAPFSTHQSSCSNHIPKTFKWSEIQTKNEVFMDGSILVGLETPRIPDVKRFAWLCESNAIIPNIRKMFDKENFDKIVNHYDGIFTCDRDLVDRHEKIHFCFAGSNLPWTKTDNYKIYDKTKIVSFIASSKLMCSGHHFRHELYEKIKRRDEEEKESIAKFTEVYGENFDYSHLPVVQLAYPIDVYGSIVGKPFGHNPGCHLEFNAPEWHDKSQALNDYMFSIVLENDQYDDYFTEKITDCFATGTVPIYWGTKNIGNYFNTDGIIQVDKDIESINSILNSLTPEMYYRRMDAIKDNFERVKNLQMADDMLVEKIKELQ